MFFIKSFGEAIIAIINDFVETVHGSFYYPNVFNEPGIMERFQITLLIARWLLIIAFLISLIVMFFNLDIFSGARLKKIIRDIILSLLFIHMGQHFIGKIHELSSLLTEIWLPTQVGVGGGEMTNVLLAAVGLSATNPLTFQALGMTLAILAGAIAVFLTLLLISHAIVLSLMKVFVIIFPIILALFPIDGAKSYTWKWITLYVGLIFLGPLQALTISITADTMSTTQLTFGSMINSIGMLITATLILPGVLFYLVTIASNPKVLE